MNHYSALLASHTCTFGLYIQLLPKRRPYRIAISKMTNISKRATLSKDCCKMFNKEQNVEECDATMFNSSNADGLIKK